MHTIYRNNFNTTCDKIHYTLPHNNIMIGENDKKDYVDFVREVIRSIFNYRTELLIQFALLFLRGRRTLVYCIRHTLA